MEIFPIPDPPTPQWLTAILRESGALPHGQVVAVQHTASAAFNSRTAFLLLSYSAAAPPTAPQRLVLKQNIASAWGVAGGADEVDFYKLLLTLPDHPRVVPPCFAAQFDSASGASYLLLEDLSLTHAPPVTRDQQIALVESVPAASQIDAVADTLALLHAYWWEHPLLSSGRFEVGYWARDSERFAAYLARRTAAWHSLVGAESDWFPASLRALYEQVFAGLPRLWERYIAPRFSAQAQLTLLHGDAYFANFLCPRDAAGRTYLLDWQSYSCDLAAADLVNLCATFWTPAQRQEDGREAHVLRRYHDGLLAAGVSGYAWDDLVRDYQIGLLDWLLVPLQDRFDGSRRDYWWPKMQCLAAAVRDWDCAALL